MPQDVQDPQKVALFRLEGGGLIQAQFQKVTRPSRGFGIASHRADDGSERKTRSNPTVGNAKISKLQSIGPVGDAFEDWLKDIYNPSTGFGKLPSQYKRTLTFRALNQDGTTAMLELWEGCFPVEDGEREYDRSSDDNTMQEYTLSVDVVRPL